MVKPWVLGSDPLPGTWTPGGPPQVWLLRIASGEPEAGEVLVLDEAERARAAGFVRDLHRTRYVAAHLGLRRLLGAYLGVPAADVLLTREPCPLCGGPHGRPAVTGAPLHFNLSHAGDLALFGFADVAVGVDVEELPGADVVADVARTLHPHETAELAALPEAERVLGFARCWTRKEAYLKGTGTGLAQSPALTYVGTGAELAGVPAGWALRDVPVDDGYVAAVATRSA
ncbi:4'-phosphopantetheinyl transferase family protein [Streptomyces gamaensis]|uniref:4'-phosphopantetheinyl transferase family protein n=1 Tax=Streptomyces gamaensis TaxID=1763542 RepID=A0ABW0YV51_9ACTN